MNHFVLKLLMNASWQVPLCGAMGWCAARMLRRWPAGWRVACWRTTIMLCAVLPILTGLWVPAAFEGGGFRIPVSIVTATRVTASETSAEVPWVSIAYLLFCGFTLARLIWRLRALRDLNEHNVTVPLALGWMRPRVILPIRFAAEAPEMARTAALVHETTHVRNRDFAYNLILEAVTLPVTFHPVLFWMKRLTTNAVEMRCDEDTAREIGDAKQYTLGLIEAARLLAPLPAPCLTLGFFDHITFFGPDALEERIMNLTQTKTNPRRWARVAAVTALAVAATLTVGLSASFAAQQDEKVYKVGEDGVKPPKLLTRTEPKYSETAREAGVSGSTVLTLEVSPKGKAENIHVRRSLEESLDQAAITAVKEWVFQPATKNGEPVRVSATIEVNFKLK